MGIVWNVVLEVGWAGFMNRILRTSFNCWLVSLVFFLSTTSKAIFIDGNGYYSLLGETRNHPGFDSGGGLFQAAKQNFHLKAEIRANDRASFFTEFRLFADPRQAYLGDTAEPGECSVEDISSSKTGNATTCTDRHQNSGEPRYRSYYPRITEAYTQYAFDSCLFSAGRRSRHWGMGIFLHGGKGPFDTDASVFDGFSCDFNIQKSQTLAFSIGYDKLSETGTSTSFGSNNDTDDEDEYGATNPSDDLDQYFFTIEYNDRKANSSTSFSQQVGFYFANIVGSKEDLETDIKIADLFLSFYMPRLVIKQEVVFRLGKSADPSWTRLGGIRSLDNEKKVNNLTSIGAAGSIELFLSRSGSIVGPEEYNEGNAKSHSIFIDYAYAPGDRDGYSDEYEILTNDDGLTIGRELRSTDVTAMAFHRNFKPALLLFNAPAEKDNLRVDGIFDPGRVMNASVISTGYRYQSIESGNFELKLIMAQLNKTMPDSLKDSDQGLGLIGYGGDTLGLELDLKYDRNLGKGVLLGIAGAIANPGKAWKKNPNDDPVTNYLLQSFIAFRF